MRSFRRYGMAILLAVSLAGTAPAVVGLRAQDAGDVKQDMKDAGKAAKDAAKATGKAAKDAAKTTKRAAKAATRAAKGQTVRATCVDGTTYAGKTRRGACAGHGGVQTWKTDK